MKNYLNLMRFDLITAVCSAGNRPAAAALLIAAAYLILVFLGVPLLSIALYIGGIMLIAPLQGAAEKYNFNKLYGILPVQMRTVIQARFLLIAVTMFFCEAAAFLIGAVSEMLHIYRFESDFAVGIGSLLTYCVMMFVFMLAALSFVEAVHWIYGQANEMKVMIYTFAGIIAAALIVGLLMYMHVLPSFEQLMKMLPESAGGKFVLYALLHLIAGGICAAFCNNTVKKVTPREL